MREGIKFLVPFRFKLTLGMTMKKQFIFSDNILWDQTAPGVQRKILGYDDQLMMVHVQFEKGAIGTVHHHIHRQVTFVESGLFEVSINGEKQQLKKGDSFFVEPDTPHGVVALDAGSLIDVFAPVRKDFL